MQTKFINAIESANEFAAPTINCTYLHTYIHTYKPTNFEFNRISAISFNNFFIELS